MLEKENGQQCGRDHDSSLHGSGSHYCSAASLLTQSWWEDVVRSESASACDNVQHVLLEMQDVVIPVNGQEVQTVMFFYNGSTATLCTHSWAKKAGLLQIDLQQAGPAAGVGIRTGSQCEDSRGKERPRGPERGMWRRLSRQKPVENTTHNLC